MLKGIADEAGAQDSTVAEASQPRQTLPSSPEEAIDNRAWGSSHIDGEWPFETGSGAQFEILKETQPESLGMMSGYSWQADPKRLAFSASRYKFVAKMLEGKRSVLEVGCADAFFSRIVRQHVGALIAVDSNYAYIGSGKKVRSPKWHIFLNQWDILKDGPLTRSFDAVYCLDVFEHIAEEDLLLGNLAKCAPLCIIGTPSLESQAYASAISKAEHVNCPTKNGLRTAMQRHFKQVLMFGQNDEVVHTGHMPAYLFGIGINASAP